MGILLLSNGLSYGKPFLRSMLATMLESGFEHVHELIARTEKLDQAAGLGQHEELEVEIPMRRCVLKGYVKLTKLKSLALARQCRQRKAQEPGEKGSPTIVLSRLGLDAFKQTETGQADPPQVETKREQLREDQHVDQPALQADLQSGQAVELVD